MLRREFLGTALALPAVLRSQDAPPKPSANAGKPGTYMAKTSRPGCNYFVYVPKACSAGAPAGLHLFFHGQGGAGLARNIELWAPEFLDKFNLIGVNMYYEDGDNAKDTEGKVQAAREAVAQVMADYKIVAGRGAIGSFSGGGLPHAMYYDAEAKKGRGAAWPFCHATLYSSNYRSKPAHQKTTPMSWTVAVGQAEWQLAGLGADGVGRMSELLGDVAQGGCPDLYFKVIKGKEHVISPLEIAEASRAFRRSDLGHAPFVYAADYPAKELRGAVEAANALQLGKAMSALDKATAVEGAARLRALLEGRLKAVLELARELAETDPPLLRYYGDLFLRQLQALPQAKELKDILHAAAKGKGYGRALGVPPLFQKSLRTFFGGNGLLAPGQAPILERIQELAGETSSYGRMAADFLKLQ
jgi:hypothetical protein